MLLQHAKVLAHEYVTRNGERYHKGGPFTAEQTAAEDWEPVPRETVTPVAADDCGCGGIDVADGSDWTSVTVDARRRTQSPVADSDDATNHQA